MKVQQVTNIIGIQNCLRGDITFLSTFLLLYKRNILELQPRSRGETSQHHGQASDARDGGLEKIIGKKNETVRTGMNQLSHWRLTVVLGPLKD